jgi:hypothetical protein
MATSKKPRKKYNPERTARERHMARVLQAPAESATQWLTELLIKNHGAMEALAKGRAAWQDLHTLVAMHNMVEAFWRKGMAGDYEHVIVDGYAALKSVIQRGVAKGRFILTGPELTALNLHMELHDELIRISSIKDVEDAMVLIKQHHREGKMERIIEFPKEQA